MDIKKHQKTPKKFICETCDFTCSRNAEYLRHLSTGKHQSKSQGYKNDIEKTQKNTDFVFSCDNCEKKYKFSSGLWRHKKLCKIQTQIIKKEEKNEPTDKELIMLLVKQNTELLEVIKNGTNNNNNNSFNKTFNLQFFLNETCKNAMNITDFVENIKVQLHDLIKVGEIGYVEGISNIITTNLKALDVTKRPIHCTDKKREVLYVKEEDKWKKEDEEKTKVRNLIKTVSNKNIKLISEFKEKYPDCKESNSKYSEQYNTLLIESMGGCENTIEKEDNIIKNISKNVIIEKE
jgi:hypothetical protein